LAGVWIARRWMPTLGRSFANRPRRKSRLAPMPSAVPIRSAPCSPRTTADAAAGELSAGAQRPAGGREQLGPGAGQLHWVTIARRDRSQCSRAIAVHAREALKSRDESKTAEVSDARPYPRRTQRPGRWHWGEVSEPEPDRGRCADRDARELPQPRRAEGPDTRIRSLEGAYRRAGRALDRVDRTLARRRRDCRNLERRRWSRTLA
jgi:hypothetical protein